MGRVQYFSESIKFKVPKPRKTSAWLDLAAKKEKSHIESLTYIFCNDAYLLKINQDFLNHDTYTDIITFDYSEGSALEGEIYISVERVRENAIRFKVDFENELARVMVHGLLHLAGYKDKGKAQKALMRKKEEAYLSLLK